MLAQVRNILTCTFRNLTLFEQIRFYCSYLVYFLLVLFKLCVLVYKVIHGLAPCYLNECASQFQLFQTFLFFVPLPLAICSYQGQGYKSATGHFVCMAGPVTWNGLSLPMDIRSAPIHYQPSKNMLKTHLFSRSMSRTNCFAANIVRRRVVTV